MQPIIGRNCVKHVHSSQMCSENYMHTYGEKSISTWHTLDSSKISLILITFSTLPRNFTENRNITQVTWQVTQYSKII